MTVKNIKILNRKESKEILAALEQQWGFSGELDYVFIRTMKEKIYLSGRDVFDLDLSKMNINTIGLYFGEMGHGLRLSIEGSQIIGPGAKKCVVELNEAEARQWLSGMDLEKKEAPDGFVIMKLKSDFLGTGKAKAGIILNMVPKVRRIKPS